MLHSEIFDTADKLYDFLTSDSLPVLCYHLSSLSLNSILIVEYKFGSFERLGRFPFGENFEYTLSSHIVVRYFIQIEPVKVVFVINLFYGKPK